jgi:hypothetical protein
MHRWPDLTIWWYWGTPGRWQAEGRDPWELCARHWVRELAVLEQGLAAVPAARRLEIRYEALVAEPLRRCDSSPPSLVWLTVGTGCKNWPGCGTRTGTSACTRSSTPQVRGRIEAIQGDDLRRLGYLG